MCVHLELVMSKEKRTDLFSGTEIGTTGERESEVLMFRKVPSFYLLSSSQPFFLVPSSLSLLFLSPVSVFSR